MTEGIMARVDHGLQQNGPVPQPRRQSQSRPRRIPTVIQALPYSPFSSIVPFSPDIITPPLALPTTTATAFKDLEDVKAARLDIERLSAGAKSAENASHRCQQTLKDIKRLLDADMATDFKFKTTKRTHPDKSGTPVKAVNLSTFARMVYDHAKVGYHYLTPESEVFRPTTGKATGVNSDAAENPMRSTAAPVVARKSGQSISSPKRAQVQVHTRPVASEKFLSPGGLPDDQVINPPKTPLSYQHVRPHGAFVVPATLTPAQRAEYHEVHLPESTISRNQAAYITNRAISSDQRQKSDQALEELQTLLQDVFTAEDQMQPDTSGNASALPSAYFATNENENSSLPLLQLDVQRGLDTAIKKVVSSGRMNDIEFDQIGRLQRLCENSMIATQSQRLEIEEQWSETDVTEWVGRLNNAQSGVVAASTMIRVMITGSQSKKVQSEEYLTGTINTIRAVAERCIIPIVEDRPTVGEKVRGEKSIPRNPKFSIASEHKKAVQLLLSTAKTALNLLGSLLLKTVIDESAISSIEYLCKSLIFAENGSTEKESAIGISVFENFRVVAMDVLAKIFTKYTAQRRDIVNDILFSLEKLPASKQSARQFRPPDCRPIQLVSALLMRLIQTSATVGGNDTRSDENDNEDQLDKDKSDVDEPGHSEISDDEIRISRGQKAGATKFQDNTCELRALYTPLKDSAQEHARYTVTMLLSRALGSSKTGDEPFRKLLDIFTDDFISVLGSSDWPAAEILLRNLVSRMVGISENPKSPAPHRTLSLELLGVIGSGILDLQTTTMTAATGLEIDDSMSERLVKWAQHTQVGDLSSTELTAFDGPYRVVLEYLDARGTDKDSHLQTARGYHLVQWADTACGNLDESVDHDTINPLTSSKELHTKIRHMIKNPQWLQENSNFVQPSTVQGKLAAKILASNSALCRAFNRIFNTILQSMSSEQPTVRSRSLKSVTTLLEKDPSVLDRNVQILGQIMRCMSDPSPLVRDSALGLVQKCVSLRPSLELRVYDRVILRTSDQSFLVRKRSMAFLKQAYLRNNDNRVRAAISNALISRIKDSDEGVADTALTTIEEVWFTSLAKLIGAGTERSIDALLQLRSHAALIIETVQIGDDVAITMEELIKTLLVKSKQAAENVRICKAFVSVLVDGMIDKNEIPGSPEQDNVLIALAVFAKAAPKLFTISQVEHLEPYTQNLKTSDDLQVFHFVITILRYTLPVLAGIDHDKLRALQANLLQSVGRIPKEELRVVAPCVWTIETVVGGTERPLKTTLSALSGLYDLRNVDLTTDTANARRAPKLLQIVGQFGKACDLEASVEKFKSAPRFSWYRGKDVSALLIEVACKFTSPKQPHFIREAALEAVSEICQSQPEHFLREDVNSAMGLVFKDKISELEQVLLTSLEAFFSLKETTSEEQEILGVGVESGSERLGNTYKATGHDTAWASLSQRFLSDFLRIALSSINEVALTAARIVVHINTRGMTHPANSAPGLVALETCPNTVIAKLAFMAHREQYAKYEQVFEKTLIKAVQQAFDYQNRVVQSVEGYTGHPPAPKLHFFWEVLRTSKPKVRNKFFTNLSASLDFDISNLKMTGQQCQHLSYVRFCVENLAFMESDSVDELVHLVSCLEKTVAGTGTSLAQMIESEALKLHVPLTSIETANGDASTSTTEDLMPAAEHGTMAKAQPIDPLRLEQLTVSAQVLSLLWETRSYLRRYWNLHKYAGKVKGLVKDVSRTPTKATNGQVLTETYLNRVNSIVATAETEEARREMCASFVDLLSIDNEIKVAPADEAADDPDGDDDIRSESGSAKSPSVCLTPRGRKRKSLDALVKMPKKKARSGKSGATKAKDSDDQNADWD